MLQVVLRKFLFGEEVSGNVELVRKQLLGGVGHAFLLCVAVRRAPW